MARFPVSISSALLAACFAAVALAGDLEDAQGLQQAGKYQDALGKYESAVAAEPGNADACLGLSEVLAGLGRYQEAADAAVAGLKQHKEHIGLLVAKARAYMLMADAAMRAGDDPKDIYAHAAECDAALMKVLEAEPDHADGNVLKAKVMQHQGDQEGALGLLVANAEKHPDHFESHWEIGLHWFRAAGRKNKDKTLWANAEQSFRRAFEADPQSGQAILHATYSAHWQGAEAKELAKGYEQAAMLLPGNGGALKQLSASLAKRPEEQLAAFRRVHAKYPDNVAVIQWYAFILRRTEKHDEAVKILKGAIAKNPGNPALVKDLAGAYLAKGDTDKAIAKYEDALKLWGGNYIKKEYDAISSVAALNPTLSPAQREKLWTALWNAYPGVADAANNAGLWYRDIGKNYDESLKWYLRAADAAPADVRILNDTGLIYHYHFNDHAKAEPFYRQAVEVAAAQEVTWSNDPNNAGMGLRDALDNLGKIFAADKRWTDLANLLEDDMPQDHPRYGFYSRLVEKEGK